MDPNTTSQAIFQFQLFNTISSLAALGASIAAIIRVSRRTPPLSETVLEKFATKEDIKALREELSTTRADLNGQLRSGDKCFKDLERVIGKLEGVLSRCPYFCSHTAMPGPSGKGVGE